MFACTQLNCEIQNSARRFHSILKVLRMKNLNYAYAFKHISIERNIIFVYARMQTCSNGVENV